MTKTLRSVVFGQHQHPTVYKTITATGIVEYMIYPDEAGNVKHIRYRDIDKGRLTIPVTWAITTQDAFFEMFGEEWSVQFDEYSARRYGEPKLEKPTVLSGVKKSFTVCTGKASHQCFINKDDIWVKHNDYFSEIWKPPLEEANQTMTALLTKYFGKSNKSQKFIYSDCFGAIVLRGQAWLRIRNAARLIVSKPFMPTPVAVIIDAIAETFGLNREDTADVWQAFVEEFVKHAARHLIKSL